MRQFVNRIGRSGAGSVLELVLAGMCIAALLSIPAHDLFNSGLPGAAALWLWILLAYRLIVSFWNRGTDDEERGE